MGHTLSAIKRRRQNQKRYEINKSVKSAVKTQIKTVFEAIEKKEAEVVKKEFVKAQSMLDKAVKYGALHKNNVSRSKSRLSNAVNQFLKKSSAG